LQEVAVRLKNILPLVASVQDMKHVPARRDACCSGHLGKLPSRQPLVNYWTYPVLLLGRRVKRVFRDEKDRSIVQRRLGNQPSDDTKHQ
jgi:hypothetical protein